MQRNFTLSNMLTPWSYGTKRKKKKRHFEGRLSSFNIKSAREQTSTHTAVSSRSLVQFVGHTRWVYVRRSNSTGRGALSTVFSTQLGVYPTLGMSTELFTSLSAIVRGANIGANFRVRGRLRLEFNRCFTDWTRPFPLSPTSRQTLLHKQTRPLFVSHSAEVKGRHNSILCP